MKSMNTVYFILIIIIFSGSFLRLYKIGKDSLWLDEFATLESSRSDIQLEKYPHNGFSFIINKLDNPPSSLYGKINQIINNTEIDSIHLPLYYLIIFFVKLLFGNSEFWLRLPSAIFGIFSILMMYPLSRQFCDKKSALISTALMAFMWYPIFYSREARMYSQFILFSMISMYCIITIFDNLRENKVSYWFVSGFIFASVLCAYTHFFGLYFYILLLIFCCVKIWMMKMNTEISVNKGLWVLAGSLLIIILLCIPVIYKSVFVMIAKSDIPNIKWIRPPELSDYPMFLNSFFAYPINSIINIVVGPNTVKSPIVRNVIYGIFVLSAFKYIAGFNNKNITLISLLLQVKDDLYKNKKYLLYIWLFIPPTIAFIISRISQPVYIPRYFVFCLPSAYILLSKALTSLSNRKTLTIFFVSVLFFIIIFDLVKIKQIYSGVNKMQFKESIEYILTHEKQYPNYFICSNLGEYGLQYYTKRFKLINQSIYFMEVFNEKYYSMESNIFPDKSKSEFTKFVKTNSYDYMWYINCFSIEESYFTQVFHKIESIQFMGVELVLFDVTSTIVH